MDALSGKKLVDPLQLDHPVDCVTLNQVGLGSDRKVAIIDRNRDLWITTIHGATPFKLASVCVGDYRLMDLYSRCCPLQMVSSARWSDESDLLVAVVDTQVKVWCYLNVIYVDRDLLPRTIQTLDEA